METAEVNKATPEEFAKWPHWTVRVDVGAPPEAVGLIPRSHVLVFDAKGRTYDEALARVSRMIAERLKERADKQ